MMPNDRSRACFGPYEVDLHTHELWKFGTRLKLVGQPFEILAVLLSKPGELVTREELRSRLWPADTFVDFNHGLNAAVNKLRDTLSDSADAPRYIETLPRRGYRFMADVQWTQPAPALSPQTSPKASPPPIVEAATALLPTSPPARSPRSLPRYLTAAAILIAAVAGAAVLLKTISGYAGPTTHSLIERTRPLLSVSDTNAPAFSPDGNFVAFSRQRSAGGESGIYVTGVGSEHLLQLTNNENDCCPVWSPDGHWIAFSRLHDHEFSIYLVPSDRGGEQKLRAEQALTTQPAAFKVSSAVSLERRLDTAGVVPHRGEIDWSPDGSSIVFSGPSGLYLARLENSSVHRLTEPPPLSEDWGAHFSPDGRTILFIRDQQRGLANEIRSVSVSGGDGRQIFSEPGRVSSPPMWSYDGRSVIFSSNRTGHPALWRVSLDAPDSATQVSQAGSPAWDPAISRRGYRLAYERLLRSLSIWQLDLSDTRDKRPYLIVSSTSDTDQGPGPQFSPDNKRLAFMSDRSGTMEIWVANQDGSNPFQLSAVGGAGTPRWAPDSQTVAFDVTTPEGSKIVTMNLHGGAPQVLTPEKSHNVCPSFSHDGKWIYFASPRSGRWQVWKVPATGGDPVQVTLQGGQAALESPDGKYLYYAKRPEAEPEIWRVPVNGGEEKLMPLVRPGTWASFQVVDGGILFVGPSLGHQAVLSFYDFAKDRTSTISILERTPFWLGATPDGKSVAFDQPGREQSQAMLVENFR